MIDANLLKLSYGISIHHAHEELHERWCCANDVERVREGKCGVEDGEERADQSHKDTLVRSMIRPALSEH